MKGKLGPGAPNVSGDRIAGRGGAGQGGDSVPVDGSHFGCRLQLPQQGEVGMRGRCLC